MNNKIVVELDNIVSEISRFRDDIHQLEQDNEKLNDDLQAMEKERDEGYKSFNTKTHILVEISELKELDGTLSELKSYTTYAYDECYSAESQTEEARGSCDSANDYAKDAVSMLDKLLTKGE